MKNEDKLKKLERMYQGDETALTLIQTTDPNNEKDMEELFGVLGLYFGLTQTQIDSLEA
ncbi:MAG: hypothetical protein PUB39_00755 [Eubacteriales bacterium]|nr:hypothetical protein [Eubacteriales bacterium]